MPEAQITGGGAKSKRRKLDFYPTPPDVTHALMKFLKLKRSVIWEPACGIGSMSEVLKSYRHRVISTDISDTGYAESVCDFLSTKKKSVDAIITNPPFVLSEEFIRHAIKQAPLVAMLLKSQYWHSKKRLTLFRATTPEYVLPLTWRPDFLFDIRKKGERACPTMECYWTVWRRGFSSQTKYVPLEK